MMSGEQVKELDKRTNPMKLLPTTIEFLKDMRSISNYGRERRGEPVIPWTAKDELR